MRAKPLILMIDDDPLFCKAFEAVLPRLGLDALAFSAGRYPRIAVFHGSLMAVIYAKEKRF